MLKTKATPVNLTSPPGVPCPQCGAALRLTLDKLVSGSPLYCTDCGLRLTVDREASAGAVAAARTVQRALRDVEGG